MAKCISNFGVSYQWLTSTPPSFYVVSVTYSIDNGNVYDNLQVPFNFTDTDSAVLQKVHNAVKLDALTRFAVILADSDIRIL